MSRPDLILRRGTVVNQDGVGLADVAVTDGRISRIGDLSGLDGGEEIDCFGLHVLPGVIDSQVHFREPGAEAKEDLESGSRAAALGGVTAVFEMPNTNPATTTPEALADKFARARGRMHVDHAFWYGATPENAETLAEAERLPGCAGIKMFMGSSTGSLLVSDDADVARVLSHGRRAVAVHSEEEPRLRARMGERVEGDPASHPVWRDEIAALMCTERLIRLAREARRRVHVLHISTAEEIPLLAANKDLISAEATPHHLTFSADDYAAQGTYIQMNPPVREARHREAVWEGLRQGIIDVLGSDHAPHEREAKEQGYPNTPSGMPGVQTLVPVMLDHVARGRMTLQRFVDLTSASQQRLFGIAGKGRLAVGYDADFTVVDLKARRTIEADWIASKCGWTPYAGREALGWPKGTILRGRRVMWEDALVEAGAGAPVRFADAAER
ncbi:MAG: dihydroorotase [Pseudomonadota bacterium]